ncbi:MAG: OmpA family protein [Spirochaetaceae bacterium]|nr:OmpA family protein [Spirochaetaceae bacterium]
MNYSRKIICVIFVISLFCVNCFSQVLIQYNQDRTYTLVERTDLRRYDNGRYIGLLSREVRSFINQDEHPKYKNFYQGDFYVLEKTKRNSFEVTLGINEAIPSSFTISEDGNLTMIEDNGFPSFRSFPTFPKDKIKIGDKWNATAERAVDPLNKGIITRLPIYIQYQYTGDGKYHDEDIFILKAQWATRYGISYFDSQGDKELKSAMGSHKADIYVSKKTGCALLVRDIVDETFVYQDGNKINFQGFITLFTEYPPAVDREIIIPSLNRIAKNNDDKNDDDTQKDFFKDKDVPDISYENTSRGIRLTIQNLQFKPNSSELLPGEENRLNQIAKVLKQAKNSMFLVEGHTASTGNISGEKQLSVERAYTIAEELIKRGISAEKFIYKGSGSSKPIATNETPEGMAKNRRVEITILE